MFLRFLVILFVSFSLINCTGNNSVSNNLSTEFQYKSPDQQYKNAMLIFQNQQYDESKEIFKKKKIYPLSNEAIQSQIMLGFTDYILLDYDAAIIKFTKIIKKYPSLKNLDYVYYMKALCYYEQIADEGLDGRYNNLALENLNQVITRFPNSKYAKDSYQKIILVKSNIAAKHMSIGRFTKRRKIYFCIKSV